MTIWSEARLPLNIEERWKWMMSQYEIEHTLWMYPEHYFVGNDKQPTIRGLFGVEHDCHLTLKKDGNRMLSQYEIEHTCYGMYPEHYFVGHDKQP